MLLFPWSPLLTHPFKECRYRFTTTDTQRRQSITCLTPLHFIKQRCHQPTAAGPGRMTDGYRATIDVDPRHIQTKYLHRQQGDGSERFVDFKQIHIADRDTGKRAYFSIAPTGASAKRSK